MGMRGSNLLGTSLLSSHANMLILYELQLINTSTHTHSNEQLMHTLCEALQIKSISHLNPARQVQKNFSNSWKLA